MFVKCDVSHAEDCQKAVAETVKYFGRLDIAFNNAGIGGASAPVAEYPVADWDRIIGINLSGVWYCMKYELEQMVKQKSGSIINMASILGHVGFANSSGYVAAKHGVIGMTKTAALDYGASGIRINAICPGFIVTPLLTHAGIEENNDFGKMIASLHPMKRMGRPEEIAKGFMYLASDEASFVHGTSLVIDGGYLAQ
jgi:NAD(P)-dependent dehydrogenase (short-subunit alcohol dehydrogenase family)